MVKKSRLELRIAPSDKASWEAAADALNLTVSELIRRRMSTPSSPSEIELGPYDVGEIYVWQAEAASLGTTLEALVRMRMTVPA